MTIRRLVVLLIGICLVAGATMAQGPRKDLGENISLPHKVVDHNASSKSLEQGRTNVLVERPSYSISEPLGNDWFYVDGEKNGVFEITFFKKADSHTHTLF